MYNKFAELIQTRADKELNVKPVNHPAAPIYVLLSQMLMMGQFGLIGAILMDFHLLPPGLRENKVASCLGSFFIGNMVSSGMTKTNAFEIYLNEKLLWSSLKAERKPEWPDLVKSFKQANINFRR